MKMICIGCEVLARPLYINAALSPHIIDIHLIRYGLHRTPTKLRESLQEIIHANSSNGYDAALLAYGLCGKATHGLKAEGIPLVIPRAHDCITVFLGSRERYQKEFESIPGTYWYVRDYIERDDGSGASLSSGVDEKVDDVYASYIEKYGKDNADYLMEVMGAWKNHYQRAAYIDMNVGDGNAIETRARSDAEKRGWSYERIQGDMTLVRRLLFGEWKQDFLVLEPGQSINMTYGEDIVSSI